MERDLATTNPRRRRKEKRKKMKKKNLLKKQNNNYSTTMIIIYRWFVTSGNGRGRRGRLMMRNRIGEVQSTCLFDSALHYPFCRRPSIKIHYYA